jgi:hypothetical protein
MPVTLRPAYAWDCEECGRENFVNGLIPCFSDEELAELRDERGIEPEAEGAFIAMPKSVVCAHCDTEFPTVHYKDS